MPFLTAAATYNGSATFVSQAGGAPNPPRSTGGLVFSPPATVVDAQRTEGEPVNWLDPNDGSYWESGPWGITTQQSFIHRSTDGGNQFNIDSPIGTRPDAGPGGGDTDIVTDDQGYAYFTDLESLVELDCAVSNDHGNTWRRNSFCVQTTGVDRQWFTIDNGSNHSIGTAGADDNTVFFGFRQELRDVHLLEPRIERQLRRDGRLRLPELVGRSRQPVVGPASLRPDPFRPGAAKPLLPVLGRRPRRADGRAREPGPAHRDRVPQRGAPGLARRRRSGRPLPGGRGGRGRKRLRGLGRRERQQRLLHGVDRRRRALARAAAGQRRGRVLERHAVGPGRKRRAGSSSPGTAVRPTWTAISCRPGTTTARPRRRSSGTATRR